MGEKFQATSPLKVYIRFTPQKNHVYSYRKGLYKSCVKICEILNFGFLPFFFVSLTWDRMGVKVSNDIASETTHQICSLKFMRTPEEGL